MSNNTPSHFATILQVIKSFDWVLSRGMRLSKLDEVRTQIATTTTPGASSFDM
jgi:hypothetical protein